MNLDDIAKKIRKHALLMTHKANSSHIGSCLSIADILAVLYFKILNIRPEQPDWPERDRFILSKGHAAAAMYATLAERGFIPAKLLEEFHKNNSLLAGHVSHVVPGVDASTGSLGHGLSMGCGMALCGKADNKSYRVFVLTGDGECDEGSIWEAALFASHHQLDNLIIIVDHNRLQGFGAVDKILDLAPFSDKWRAFGWEVKEINGHDISEIEKTLANLPIKSNKPTCIIAKTIKGKGVHFMENQLAWHYKSPNAEQLALALKELDSVN
jgi:transketolase